MADNYFNRPEVSNSRLSELWYAILDRKYYHDVEAAYAFGRLLDILITEPEEANAFKRSIRSSEGVETFSPEDWRKAERMRIRYLTDDYCKHLAQVMTGQVVKTRDIEISYNGFTFTLPFRCKYDLDNEAIRIGGDIKSTTATTLKQFYAACEYFDYDRQRALYMDISGYDKDILIGISKTEPHDIFKIHIERGDPFYRSGRDKYERLAFQYWSLLGTV